MSITTREPKEIQKAHDILLAVLLGEVDIGPLDPAVFGRMGAVADALCWVLQHDHNDTFERYYQALQKAIESTGAVLIDQGSPKPHPRRSPNA